MSIQRSFFTIALLAALGCEAQKANEIKVDIVDYGLLGSCESRQAADPRGRYPAVHDPSDCDVVETTNDIAANVGSTFGGFFVAASSEPYVILTIEWIHPEIKNSDSSGATSSWSSVQRVQANFPFPVTYTSGEPWEAVPGAGHVRVRSGESLLSEVTFDVRKTDDRSAS